MIDLHVLTLPERDQKRCLDSLQHPQVAVHVLPGVPGHIGQGRRAGYALGTSPWVGYVDDDDWLEPGALDVLLSLLDDSLALLQVAFVLEYPEGPQTLRDKAGCFLAPIYTRQMDHFCIYRREMLEPLLPAYADYPRGGDVMMRSRFAEMYPAGKMLRVNLPLYHWSRS